MSDTAESKEKPVTRQVVQAESLVLGFTPRVLAAVLLACAAVIGFGIRLKSDVDRNAEALNAHAASLTVVEERLRQRQTEYETAATRLSDTDRAIFETRLLAIVRQVEQTNVSLERNTTQLHELAVKQGESTARLELVVRLLAGFDKTAQQPVTPNSIPQ